LRGLPGGSAVFSVPRAQWCAASYCVCVAVPRREVLHIWFVFRDLLRGEILEGAMRRARGCLVVTEGWSLRVSFFVAGSLTG